jgi:hypothetical protein
MFVCVCRPHHVHRAPPVVGPPRLISMLGSLVCRAIGTACGLSIVAMEPRCESLVVPRGDRQWLQQYSNAIACKRIQTHLAC